MVNIITVNEVALHWARLLPGLVTVCWHMNHLGVYPTTYVNSVFYPTGVGSLNRVPACLAGG